MNIMHSTWALCLAGIVAGGTISAQDILLTNFRDGHLTFTSSLPPTQRVLYSIEWRPNLAAGSTWTGDWSGLQELIGFTNVVTVDVPMFYRVAAYPDLLTTNSADLWLMYSNAMVDASNALPDKICNRLTAVIPENPNLVWRTNSAGAVQLKVVSLMSARTATNYYQVGPHDLNYGDQWVTAYPELKDFFATFRGPDPLLRMKQILGMPPVSASDTVVEFWVNPDALFRPTPEPGITSTSAGPLLSTNAPFLTPNSRLPSFWPAWYNATYLSRNYGMTNGVYNAWPWTRLGYTYDWASTRPNHVGLSEFVIPSGTLWSVQSNTVPIEVEALVPAATYGKL